MGLSRGESSAEGETGACDLSRLSLRTGVLGGGLAPCCSHHLSCPHDGSVRPRAHLGGGLPPQQVARWAQCREVLPSRVSVEGGSCLGQAVSPVTLCDGQSAAWAPLTGTLPFLSSQDPGANPGSPSPQRGGRGGPGVWGGVCQAARPGPHSWAASAFQDIIN